jgi:hypothetical protein
VFGAKYRSWSSYLYSHNKIILSQNRPHVFTVCPIFVLRSVLVLYTVCSNLCAFAAGSNSERTFATTQRVSQPIRNLRNFSIFG